jgi:hypothetical protein
VFYESRGHNLDVLSFAGTTDRIGVSYSFLGPQLASGDLHDVWTRNRAILERHLAALS